MISKVTHSAWGRPGSLSATCQLARPAGWIGAEAVPVGEAQREHADQRDDAEHHEHHQRRQRHPGDRTAPPDAAEPMPAAAVACDGRSGHGHGSPADRERRRGQSNHWPMTAFMLSANCCGEIDSWNSLAMLSSSVSAAVGLSAWSQDWAKTFALLAVS